MTMTSKAGKGVPAANNLENWQKGMPAGPGASAEDASRTLHQRLGAIDPRQVAAWRAMTPARRLELVFQAYQLALDLVRLTEQQRHPDPSPDDLVWRVARRMQGNPTLGR
jgi:hypothetical protein